MADVYSHVWEVESGASIPLPLARFDSIYVSLDSAGVVGQVVSPLRTAARSRPIPRTNRCRFGRSFEETAAFQG